MYRKQVLAGVFRHPVALWEAEVGDKNNTKQQLIAESECSRASEFTFKLLLEYQIRVL